MRFLWLGVKCKSPPHWQMSVLVSLPQQYGLWQLEINWSLQFWHKNQLQWYWFKGQNTRPLKRFVCKLLWFLLRRRFCQQNWWYVAQPYTSLTRYFFVTMPQEARRGKSWGGTSKQASKQTLQAIVLSVHCLQTNEKTEGQNAYSSWL